MKLSKRQGTPVALSNCWVVPYNPFLLKRYNAHINVELSGSMKTVKYLYKYIYKGPDKAMTEVSINAGSIKRGPPVPRLSVLLCT